MPDTIASDARGPAGALNYGRGRVARKRRRTIVYAVAALIVFAALSTVIVRWYRWHSLAGAGDYSHHGVAGYNLMFDCSDTFAPNTRRCVLYPKDLGPRPWPGDFTTYELQRVMNPNPETHRLQMRDGKIVYGGRTTPFPPGMNTVIVAPDGRMTFLSLADQYFRFGPEKLGGTRGFVAAKRFAVDVDAEALLRAGLLPAWALPGGGASTQPGARR